MNNKLQVRACAGPWHNGIEFLIKQGMATAEPIIMQERDEGMYKEPSFVLDDNTAQVLMDDLWHSGLRPTEGTGSAGALAATQKHLEDMRTLVFKK